VRVPAFTWPLLGIAALALLTTGGQIVGFYTDWLWFREVRFTSVFVTVLQTQILLGVVTAAVFFLLLYGTVTLVRAEAALGNFRALSLDHEPPLEPPVPISNSRGDDPTGVAGRPRALERALHHRGDPHAVDLAVFSSTASDIAQEPSQLRSGLQ
jgi:hypothetical protein